VTTCLKKSYRKITFLPEKLPKATSLDPAHISHRKNLANPEIFYFKDVASSS
jgi:hypothetical protein